MGYKRIKFCFICLLVQFLDLSFSTHILKNNLNRSLDAILHDHALKVMTRQHLHTDKLYNASLLEYLAGIKVSVVKLRSTTLWKKGADFSDFIIPPKTLPTPYVKRLLIVYYNLGNLSSSYYTLSGYTLLSPVVGFLTYDASSYSNTKNLSKIELNTNGTPISIGFHSSSLLATYQTTKCAEFGLYGQIFLSDMILPNICYTKSEGRFSIVIPFMLKKKCRLTFWVVGFLGGFLGLILLGFVGTVGARSLMSKRNQEMDKEEDEEECLDTYWIDSSKMPRAEVTRTKPVLESDTTLLNPKLSWYA